MVLLLLLGATACSDPDDGPPQPSTGDPLRAEVTRRLDEATADGFSGAVLVAVDGERLVHAGYGLADRDGGVANTAETAFDFGSVMKDLTAAAIFQLEAEGKLAVEDTLDTVFDDVPADKTGITLLQILQHRAGFDEYHDYGTDFDAMTQLEARARILEQELLFEPGADEAYSNAGFTLLADVVQTVSGEAFTDFVRTSLLVPAGMTHSGFYGDPVWSSVDTAIGYGDLTFQDNDPASWPYTWALMGNGGLVTTVADMEAWMLSVAQGKVLAPSALEAYRAQYLSLGAAELEGNTVYSYAGGGDYGHGGVASDTPALGTRVIIGSNAFTSFDVEGFFEELTLLVLGED